MDGSWGFRMICQAPARNSWDAPHSPMGRQGSSHNMPPGYSPARPDRNPSPMSPSQFPPPTTIQSNSLNRYPSPRYASPSVADFPGPNEATPSRRFDFMEQHRRQRVSASPSRRDLPMPVSRVGFNEQGFCCFSRKQ